MTTQHLNLKELATLLKESNQERHEELSQFGTCPPALSGLHAINWFPVPEVTHYGDHGTTTTPASQRGFCWNCNERFTR